MKVRNKLDIQVFIIQDSAGIFAWDNWQGIFESGDRSILLHNADDVYHIQPDW